MQKRCPEFIAYVGPMAASKTSKLLMTLERFKYQNKRVVAFKPQIDGRYDNDSIVTHNGYSWPAVNVHSGDDIVNHVTALDECPDVIAVDEAFMIKGCAEALIWLYRMGFTVVVSSIDISSGGKPFPEVTEMLPWATVIDKCSAVCTICGADARYTHRKAEDVVGMEIKVGGMDEYDPRCWTHSVNINLRDR